MPNNQFREGGVQDALANASRAGLSTWIKSPCFKSRHLMACSSSTRLCDLSTQIHFLIALETKCPRSRCQQTQLFLLKALDVNSSRDSHLAPVELLVIVGFPWLVDLSIWSLFPHPHTVLPVQMLSFYYWGGMHANPFFLTDCICNNSFCLFCFCF